ncbi:nucleotidyltransferase family protein [Psychrosphaera aquimarina]|uniref:Nucleotidyltransferase family protein n=1 Tax=Psychrosphaera aquimarina TaxID=2044854 RepID=A0ABU3R5I6_9GAMM|nr:nucleotidyltransferase family protein [Psychrosphaera aquimarina]MDU0114563.1 nucleotidyltransferase family protein [Psychrosphaera aquimarina]
MLKPLSETIQELTIYESDSLLSALKKMDDIGKKLLIILSEKQKFSNLISIGDIQRAIINGTDLQEFICNIKIESKLVMSEPVTIKKVQDKILELRCEYMPVIDDSNNISNIYFWDDLFTNKKILDNRKISLPVVIMAGGQGTRLKPISNVLPKPLTPIGDSTIVEEIMSRFSAFGCSNFYLSVNYKKELIKYYLANNSEFKDIVYFVEDKPLGTAGSLSLLKGKISQPFFVSNCDILIDQDLAELYEYHKNNKNEITMVAALKHIPISYGTLETKEDGLLESMKEKPELTFKINAGVYILEPHLLEQIPDDTFFHITELIENVRANGGRVGVYPISEKSWMDIGEWPEYIKTVRALSNAINFKGL